MQKKMKISVKIAEKCRKVLLCAKVTLTKHGLQRTHEAVILNDQSENFDIIFASATNDQRDDWK